jgi:hypothetical protein
MAAWVKLFSYVVARDFGFAPNPFFGVCTLATCKPVIRRTANVGDWIVGIGSASKQRQQHLVFIMKVDEVLTFDQYWNDHRFLAKHPNLMGSQKQAFGDNIYSRKKGTSVWIQENSHHSLEDGSPNYANIKNDTQTNRMLVGFEFAYWGGHGPKIPKSFLDVCVKRAHKNRFSVSFIQKFIAWFRSLNQVGYLGPPIEW